MKKYFIFWIITIVSIITHISLIPAGPVTHGLLGYLWLDQCGIHYSQKQQNNFIIGNLFPDIRHPAELPRNITHEVDISLADIYHQTDGFLAGKKFHAWVDDARESFMNPERKQSLYALFSDVPESDLSLFVKFLEDEVLFSRANWNRVRSAITTINPNELKFPISITTLKEWHQLILDHFTYSPHAIFDQLAKANQPYGVIKPSIVNSWSKALSFYSQLPEVQCHVQDLMHYFKQKLQNCFSAQTYPYN
jgi:hypothetical protein